jgi:hypothetical protein
MFVLLTEAEKVSKELSSLRGYVFRTLRFLFSMERNRKVGDREAHSRSCNTAGPRLGAMS